MKSLLSFFVVGKVIYSSFHLYIMFTCLYVLYWDNLSLRTFFNIYFSFKIFRIFEFVRMINFIIYRGVENCFARSCKHRQNRVEFFPVFFPCFFLFFFLFFVFTPTEFTVAELCDDNACTGLSTFSIVRKKGSGLETVSYSRLDLPYTQIQCQTEYKQTES